MEKVITIDGPSGVGKGTISHLVAQYLKWSYLDSGALYRITAYATELNHINIENDLNSELENKIAKLALNLNIEFTYNGQTLLENKNIEKHIRNESCGNKASIIAAMSKVREALLQKQKDFLTDTGLIADGRDMGTVVFPNALLKIYLNASAQERGKRRYKQLIESSKNAIVAGSSVNKSSDLSIKEIITEIEQRDERDMNRSASPLKPANDAILIDTTDLSIDEVFKKIITLIPKST